MTVKELIEALQQYDADLPVVLCSRHPEFDVTEDAAVAPPYTDREFKRFVFLDPRT